MRHENKEERIEVGGKNKFGVWLQVGYGFGYGNGYGYGYGYG